MPDKAWTGDDTPPQLFRHPLDLPSEDDSATQAGGAAKSFRVLLIEDQPGDARFIEELLPQVGGIRFEVEWVKRLIQGLDRLAEGGIDVVLLDLSLPESRGLQTFRQV